MNISDVELLAPAGGPDAGMAALHYGANAVYLGLSRFSARAEAENFTPQQLGELVAYAHSLSPRRNVYLTLNTLLKDSDLPGAADTLLTACECGVDAVIIQDIAAAAMVRRHFPSLRMHASTQMAIHSLDGALGAKELGFERVTLARELTLAEVESIAAESGLEIETFIHGTLCYSYSGLCLYSSMTTGRSGNRGRCVYSCREQAVDLASGQASHPFSLKDMALKERVLDLVGAGVKSFKIEGRKKSPLYVAATVDFYRRILDGSLRGGGVAEAEKKLKTIFARPWTTLFADGVRNPDAADIDVVGHRGAPLGTVEKLVATPVGPGLAFTPSMDMERHDGMQIDVPGHERPFGFPVDNLYRQVGTRWKSDFKIVAGEPAAVALPADFPPELRTGLPLYLSSSQEVKRTYSFDRPRPGVFAARVGLDLTLSLVPLPGADSGAATDGAIRCSVRCGVVAQAACGKAAHSFEEECQAFPAKTPAGAEQGAKAAFDRMGGAFAVASWEFRNPGSLFIKPGDWNAIRRRIVAVMEAELESSRAAFLGMLPTTVRESPTPHDASESLSWSLFVDSPETVAEFTDEDFARCDEICIAIPSADTEYSRRSIDALAARIGPDAAQKLRIAYPLLLRHGAEREWQAVARELHADGWRRWMVSGMAGWHAIRKIGSVDLAADWPLNVLNCAAAAQYITLGFSSFTISPEADADCIGKIAPRFSGNAVCIAYSFLPLFLSAACVHSHLGKCRRGACRKGCSPTPLRLSMPNDVIVDVFPTACGSMVVDSTPYLLAGHMDELRTIGVRKVRAEFRWQPYEARKAVDVWRGLHSGKSLPGKAGNYRRGLT